MLFASRRHMAIRIGEIGIASGAGMQVLRAYFPRADLIGFESHAPHINQCEALGLSNVSYAPIDVRSAGSIASAFETAGGRFDIVIDDATHRPQDQARAIEGVYPFLAPGGTMIVEDVWEGESEEIFEKAIEPLDLDFAAFVFPEHRELGHGWKNDKLLVLVRSARQR